MIPILYEKTETSFSSNGIGRLADCIRCTVTEERNGVFECEFEYPVTGLMFDQIQEGRIIGATHDDNHDVQPFDIYAKSEPINGIVTFNAHHISYRMNENAVKPFTATSCADAVSKINTNSVLANPFTYWTNKSVDSEFIVDTPTNIKALLCGEEGSLLDVYGTGEYEYDKFVVRLYLRRGQDTNVNIRYGKNLVDFENKYSISDSYTGVVPYWYGDVTEEGEDEGDESTTETVLVTLPEWYISSGHAIDSGREVLMPLDLSDEFEAPPTEAELRTLATSRLSSSDGWLPDQTITVDFVQLWGTEEYADYAVLQRLNLCDTCGVFVPMYDISVRAKVIKTVYNTLLDRYDQMELGDKPTTFVAVVEKNYNSKVAKFNAEFQSINADLETVRQNANIYTDTQIANAEVTIQQAYEQAISDATDLIRGGTGGYIVTGVNANGQPIELLVTDNMNINQATNVWRWNLGGLGFSSNGYNGPYTTAITQNGAIVADFITTGTLTANIIKAGVLSDINNVTSFNLATGELKMRSGSISLGPYDDFTVTSAGKLTMRKGSITLGPNDEFSVDENGNLEATSGTFGGWTIVSANDGNDYIVSDYDTSGVYYRTWLRSATYTEKGSTWALSTQVSTDGTTYTGAFIAKANGAVYSNPKYSSGNNSDVKFETDTSKCYIQNQHTLLQVEANSISMTSSNGAVIIDSSGLNLDLGTTQSSAQPNVTWTGTGYLRYTTWTGSSETIKEKIKAIADPELDPKNLYDVDIVQFKYADDILAKDDQRHGKDLIGFIIEDLDKKYPVAVDKTGEDPSKWNWNMAYLIPAMMKLIQDQHKDIEDIKKQLEANNGREDKNTSGECS